jgi:hypothetical protein
MRESGKKVSNRLLKKAHLLRWLTRALVAAYLEYASLGPSRAALHLDLFEQPDRQRVFQHPARVGALRCRGAGEQGGRGDCELMVG